MTFKHTFLVQCNILKGMLNMELKNAQIVQRPCYALKMNFRVGLPMRFLSTKKKEQHNPCKKWKSLLFLQ